MTLPSERKNSLKAAMRLLFRLLDPKQTPRVPKSVRTEAYWALRHFPADFEIDQYWKEKDPFTYSPSSKK